MGLANKHWTATELKAEFDRLYQENEQKVFSLAWRLTGDEDAAQDIRQKTFLTLHTKLRKVLNHPNPEGWFTKTVHFYVKHYKREKAYRLKHEASIELAEQMAMPQPIDELKDFLDRIPPWIKDTEKEMLVLYYYHCYSLREIAVKLGLTYGAARVRMTRLHNRLREQGFSKLP